MGNLLGSVIPPEDAASARLDLSRTRRKVGAIAIVGAAYYVSARFGLDLSVVEHNVSPLWPPTGIALIAFLLAGPGVWPAVFAGAFLANLPVSASPVWALVTAGGNTLAPLAAAALLERIGFRRELDRLRDALAIVVAALFGMTVSATVGTAALVAEGSISGGSATGAATDPSGPRGRGGSPLRDTRDRGLGGARRRSQPVVPPTAADRLGGLAVPAARRRPGGVDRGRERVVERGARDGAVRLGLARPSDAHAPGLQHLDRAVLVRVRRGCLRASARAA